MAPCGMGSGAVQSRMMLSWILLLATGAVDPTVQDRMSEVSPERMKACVDRLAGFGTRHTLSDTQSQTRGIGAARRWILDTMGSFNPPGGPLTASLEEFDVPKSVRVPDGAHIVNVVGVLPGTLSPQRAYYVVGHYDSRNADAMDVSGDAPGANDDASGTAVVLELARVLAAHPLESTIVFLCTAGEEQGLLGAKAHAEHASREPGRIISGVLNNDIVGDPWGDKERLGDSGKVDRQGRADYTVRVFSEGLPRTTNPEMLAKIRSLAEEYDSPSRQLARYIADVAAGEQTQAQPMLVFRPDRFLRGGDHIAFNEAGFAAVRFTAVNEDFTRQHADVIMKEGRPYGDVPAYVDGEYLARVARLNLATLSHLANAPSVPARVRVVTAKLENDTTLRWDKSPEPDVAGYEVVWRETIQWNWNHVKDVGTTTEATLTTSKDNVFFGVRAYDRDGNRSPVGFATDGKD